MISPTHIAVLADHYKPTNMNTLRTQYYHTTWLAQFKNTSDKDLVGLIDENTVFKWYQQTPSTISISTTSPLFYVSTSVLPGLPSLLNVFSVSLSTLSASKRDICSAAEVRFEGLAPKETTQIDGWNMFPFISRPSFWNVLFEVCYVWGYGHTRNILVEFASRKGIYW